MKEGVSDRVAAIAVAGMETIFTISATVFLSRVVDQISQGEASLPETLPLAIVYVASVYMGTVFNIGLGQWAGRGRIEAFTTAWNRFLPLQVTVAQRKKWESFFSCIWDQVPRLRELEIGLFALYAQVVVVYSALLFRALTTGHYELLILSVPLLLLNLGANRVQANSWHKSIQLNQLEKAAFLGWHHRYFVSSGNIWRAWRLNENQNYQVNWLREISGKVRGGLIRTWKIQLYRAMTKSLLCDLPFYLGISLFLYLGIVGRISVGSIFFWLTMNELLYRANSQVRGILDRRTEIGALRATLEKELSEFSSGQPEKMAGPSGTSVGDMPVPYDLMTGQTLSLSPKFGLQVIRAGNGSGKSHLLRILAGDESDVSVGAQAVRVCFAHRRVVLIDAEFEPLGFRTVDEEILGPRSEYGWDRWLENASFSEDLTSRWRMTVTAIVDKYRGVADLSAASKGEKALFAMARALTFIESADLVLVDEVDAPLTGPAEELVHNTLEALSRRATVIVVSHRSSRVYNSLDERGIFLGYNAKKDEGLAVPFILKMTEDGGGERSAVGNVARDMMNLLDLTVELLASTFPDFKPLKKMSFTLQCHISGAKIRGIDSAGLALVLALINLKRKMRGEQPFIGYAATGHVDLTGTVHAVAGLEPKKRAAYSAGFGCLLSGDDVDCVQKLEEQLGERLVSTM